MRVNTCDRSWSPWCARRSSKSGNDREQGPGEILDRFLEGREIGFKRDFDPRAWRRRHHRHVPFAVGASAAAAALIVVAVLEHPASVAHVLQPPTRHLALARPPKDFWQRLGMVAENSVPLWMTPQQGPLKEVLYTGHAMVNGFQASQVVAVDAGARTEFAVGFLDAEPVWVSEKSHKPVPVSLSPVVAPASGRWQPGGPTALSSFSAAGPDVYITNGPEWALLTGAMNVHWGEDPASDAVKGQIVSLPSAPRQALLLTESASGSERLYLRGVHGQWKEVTPPNNPITQLVALGHEYWALANGTLYVSENGSRWTTRYAPPPNFSIATFAVGERGSSTLAAVSLTPVGEPGLGPVFRSTDGGLRWTNIGVPWPNGSAPQQMVVTPDGGVAALLPGPPAILEQWTPASSRWTVIDLPHPNTSGVGQLTAFSNGDLLYADSQGNLYRYLHSVSEWQPLPRAPGVPASTEPNLLMAIGDHQVLLAYPQGWWVLVLK